VARELCRVADVDCRRRLRSASTLELHVPPTGRISVGDRATAVSAAPRVCNALPSDVITSPSLIDGSTHCSSAARFISYSLTPDPILRDTVVGFIFFLLLSALGVFS